MKHISKQIIVSTCAILMPLVSALMVPQPTKIMKLLPNNKMRHSSSALNFHNPSMDHLDSYRSNYRARESPISLGNRFRTVPKPYYDSNFQHKPARPLSSPPLARSTPSSSTAAASSPDFSEYSTQNVYWSDVNGFPQDIVDPQAMPSIDDMRNAAAMGDNVGPMNNDDRIYSPDKYYQTNPHQPGASASNFEDIPFQSNQNYARKFSRNAEREYGMDGMNGDFGGRPMDVPYNPDMMRPDEMNMGERYGYEMQQPGPGMEQNDFPSLMNEIMPPGGAGGQMGDPFVYGGGQGYGQPYGGGMGMMGGGEMMGGMMGGGIGMEMPRGEWGFQEMGMGPGGEQWGYQEWGCGAPPGGDFYGGGPGQPGEWGMMPLGGGGGGFGEPFGGPGGPGGFW